MRFVAAVESEVAPNRTCGDSGGQDPVMTHGPTQFPLLALQVEQGLSVKTS